MKFSDYFLIFLVKYLSQSFGITGDGTMYLYNSFTKSNKI